jgi:hypothetical protein
MQLLYSSNHSFSGSGLKALMYRASCLAEVLCQDASTGSTNPLLLTADGSCFEDVTLRLSSSTTYATLQHRQHLTQSANTTKTLLPLPALILTISAVLFC